MTEGQKLSPHVGPELTDRELGEQWRRIEARLGPTRPRRVFGLATVAALAVVAVVGVLLVAHKRAAPSAWDGAVLDSGANHVSVALGDGSHIELMPVSRVRVVEGSARSVRLDLQKGSAHFDVTHVAGRTFSVKSGKVTIHVVGTRFSVTTAELAGGRRVSVAVEQGVIEAESGPAGETTRVRAGETWSTVDTATPPEPSTASTAAAEASKLAPATHDATATQEAPVAAVPNVAAVNAAGTNTANVANAANIAPKQAEALAARPASGALPERSGKPQPAAQELFETANSARQGGDARAAAASYEALLQHFPKDARAGLSAFELGRLRMDQLGDMRGAVAALTRAVGSAPGSGFREDALARLSRAYGALGDVASCERMRSAYLASYPTGVHAAAVRQGCSR